ncbi:MFS general substrate transporter [Anaeromyces robustus]|uniref:MFS general substrate transporter n=1 Tax=Anaeromyces robustus TaxID=1754192 RepID=A0A1Y1XKP2_9FUNG|nr:MFS general substrate transporter [Anaeromyces robustus]|eukprot:ORX86272.1 MFS general substrate transporter [Anaeromyces robustus]
MEEKVQIDITMYEEKVKIVDEKEEMQKNSKILNKGSSLDDVNVKLSKVNDNILSLIISSLDISIVATALPTISNQFNSKEEYTWVVTAYLLAKTAFQPMFGKFADIFGRKPVMICVLIVFISTSTVCGAAQNIQMLIIFRGIQGIGGGGIMAMTNIIISDIVPLKKRGVYMGISGAVFACSSVIGPLVGGLFTDKLSWRWAFYINIPVGIAAIIVIFLYVNIPTPPGSISEKIKKIDFIGTFFLVASVVSLLLGLSWGGTKFSWTSTVIILLFVGFFIGGTIYLYVEWKIAKEPITPFQIFKNKNVALCCLISFFLGITFIGVTNTMPLLYQDGRGISATLSGLRLVPYSTTLSIGNIGSGYLIGKYGYVERYMRTGAFSLIIAAYLVSLFGMNSSYYFEGFVLALLGISVGMNMQNSVLVTQQSAEKKFLAIGTTLINFCRLIGGVMGITIIGAMISNKFPKYYNERYPGVKVSVNGIHKVPNGEEIYVEAIQISYRIINVSTAVITFMFTLFLSDIPKIGNRKKENKKNKMEMEEKLKNSETEDVEISINTIETPINNNSKDNSDNSINKISSLLNESEKDTLKSNKIRKNSINLENKKEENKN